MPEKFIPEVSKEIPLNVHVECTDGVYGRSAYLLVNLVTE